LVVSKKEISHLRQNIQSSSTNHTKSNGITEDVFKDVSEDWKERGSDGLAVDGV
jgi:hypothetical protein